MTAEQKCTIEILQHRIADVKRIKKPPSKRQTAETIAEIEAKYPGCSVFVDDGGRVLHIKGIPQPKKLRKKKAA